MSARRSHAHADDFTPAKQPLIVTEDLPLFAEPVHVEVSPPTIRTPAPAAPGSATSEEAASTVTDPCRAASHAKIMVELYRAERRGEGPLTREQLCVRCYMKESAACARIAELRPTWVQRHDGAGTASSGCAVDTYSLTEAGRARVHEWSREFPKPERPQL